MPLVRLDPGQSNSRMARLRSWLAGEITWFALHACGSQPDVPSSLRCGVACKVELRLDILLLWLERRARTQADLAFGNIDASHLPDMPLLPFQRPYL